MAEAVAKDLRRPQETPAPFCCHAGKTGIKGKRRQVERSS